MLKFIELNENALIHNLKSIKNLLSKQTIFLFVVKANAYGHGIKEIINISKKIDIIDWFGVHSIEEALYLREQNIKKNILILGYVERKLLNEGIINNFRFTVYDKHTIKQIDEAAKKLSKKAFIHLKLETGTARQGITENDWPEIRDTLNNLGNTVLEGVSSHFANIEDTTDHSYANYQFERFNRFLETIKKDGFNFLIKHFSCSASALLFPHTHLDMVRVGISAYGYWPSRETYLSFLINKQNKLKLKKVLSFHTKVSQIKELPQNSFIGYGLTYKTTSKTKVAILPVGYFDGIDRKLSNSGYFLLKGKRVPIIGRVCMNITIIDITDIKDVSVEDKVTLIGKSRDEAITADEWAQKLNTINYEIISRLSPFIPRIIKKRE